MGLLGDPDDNLSKLRIVRSNWLEPLDRLAEMLAAEPKTFGDSKAMFDSLLLPGVRIAGTFSNAL
jgi:hypothetical protein